MYLIRIPSQVRHAVRHAVRNPHQSTSTGAAPHDRTRPTRLSDEVRLTGRQKTTILGEVVSAVWYLPARLETSGRERANT